MFFQPKILPLQCILCEKMFDVSTMSGPSANKLPTTGFWKCPNCTLEWKKFINKCPLKDQKTEMFLVPKSAVLPVFGEFDEICNLSADRGMRNGKASPLLIAVGPKDKENLANPTVVKTKNAPGVLKKKTALKSSIKFGNKNIEMIKNQINNVNTEQAALKKAINADDLTTTGNPGEAYWEQLSESRRIALEATWKENFELHSKVMELEYENTKLKAMLAEAKTSIQIMTELLAENESDVDEPLGDVSEVVDSDSEDNTEDASFTSI